MPRKQYDLLKGIELENTCVVQEDLIDLESSFVGIVTEAIPEMPPQATNIDLDFLGENVNELWETLQEKFSFDN